MLASFIARNYAMYALASQYQGAKLVVPTVPYPYPQQRHFDQGEVSSDGVMLHHNNASSSAANTIPTSARETDSKDANSCSSEIKFSIDRILAKDNVCCSSTSADFKQVHGMKSDPDDTGFCGTNIDDVHGANLDVTEEALKYSWLQCTRYKPPKLQRFRKKDGGKKRKLGRNPRVPFTQHQVASLEQKFSRTHYLSSMDVAELSAALNLTETRVKIWFQNRRARERRDRDSKHRVGHDQTSTRTQPCGYGTSSPSSNSWILAPSASPTNLPHYPESLQHGGSAFSVVSYKHGCKGN